MARAATDVCRGSDALHGLLKQSPRLHRSTENRCSRAPRRLL